MLSKTDIKYFNKAREIAEISDFSNIHIGCVAVYQGNIIGVGFNTHKTHPIQKYYNRYREKDNGKFMPKLHAEINCLNSIRHMNIQFSKVKLYIYRPRVSKLYGICRPCPSCMAAIHDLGIKHIYYTTDFGFAYEKLENDYVGGIA